MYQRSVKLTSPILGTECRRGLKGERTYVWEVIIPVWSRNPGGP